jgi:hypothetical protein
MNSKITITKRAPQQSAIQFMFRRASLTFL